MTVQQVEKPRRTYSGQQVFPVVTALMFALSALFWTPVIIGAIEAENVVGPVAMIIGAALLLAAFLAGELFPLQIEVRRETILVTGSELPMVLGLLVLPPWLVGVTHIAAGAVVFLIRRDSLRNIALNMSLITAEAGAATLVAHLLLGEKGDAQTGLRLFAVTLGVLAGALASAGGAALTYRLMGQSEPLARMLGRSMLVAGAIVTFGLVGYLVWNAGGPGTIYGPVVCLALTAVLAVLYRTYFLFLRQHTDLARMYTFGRRVTSVGSSIGDWQGILEQVRDQLNAEVAVLRLSDGDGTPRTLALGTDGVIDEPPMGDDDPLLTTARITGRARASTDREPVPAVLDALLARKAWDVLVVPLRSGDRDRGYLEVRDRLSRWGRFRDQDLQLLETLSGHVATALDNLRLLETLRHEAYHDAITGLRNRLGLHVEGQAALSQGWGSAIILVELDVLSQVNNALGHDRGERLLRMAGERLVGLVGESRPVARVEADRFAILVNAMQESELMALGYQVLAAVGRGYSIDGIEVDPQPCVGIAFVGAGSPAIATLAAGTDAVDASADAGVDPSTLLQRAEMAMLSAKAKQESLQVYRPSMGEVYRRRFQLVTQFRQAVEQGRIIVHYQPKVDLAKRQLVGVEALVRWMHPEFGLVSPVEFVEAIEATGSIDILLGHVLDLVLRQLHEWTEQGIRITAAVNLSVRNLLGDDFSTMVEKSLCRHQVPAELLTFEITESSVMADPEHSLPILQELHSMGIGLSVDDFGTGYSSLAYLRRLPIDEIKIDKSFVLGMGTDLSDLAIVRAIVDLGHSLGLRVVAEGVEEEAARDALLEMKCDQAQGYLIARPMPMDKFDAWVQARTVSMYDPSSTTHVLRMMS